MSVPPPPPPGVAVPAYPLPTGVPAPAYGLPSLPVIAPIVPPGPTPTPSAAPPAPSAAPSAPPSRGDEGEDHAASDDAGAEPSKPDGSRRLRARKTTGERRVSARRAPARRPAGAKSERRRAATDPSRRVASYGRPSAGPRGQTIAIAAAVVFAVGGIILAAVLPPSRPAATPAEVGTDSGSGLRAALPSTEDPPESADVSPEETDDDDDGIGQTDDDRWDLVVDARTEVRAAIGRSDIGAARRAVATLRAQLDDRADAATWARAATDLDGEIDAFLARLITEAERRFGPMLQQGAFREAERIVEELREVASPALRPRIDRLAQRIDLARSALAEGRPVEPDDDDDGPQVVVVRPGTGAIAPTDPAPSSDPEGAARLAAARKTLAAERAREAELLAARAARVAERTKKTPIELEIAGVDLGACQVTAFDADGVALTGPKATLRVRWNQLPLDQVYLLRRIALSDDDASGWYALGRYMALHDKLGPAERCFAKAAADPSYADRIPDLDQLRVQPELFAGDWSKKGREGLRIRWAFDEEAEASDFEPGDQVRIGVGGGRFSVTGPRGVFEATLKETRFRDAVAVRVLGLGGTAEAAFGLRFFLTSERFLTLLVIRHAADGSIALYRETQEAFVPQVNDLFDVKPNEPISLVMNRGQITLLAGKRTLWSGFEGGFSDCWVVIGGYNETGGSQSATFEAVEIEGRVPPGWFQRNELEGKAKLRRALELDLELTDVAILEDVVPEIDASRLPPLASAVQSLVTRGLELLRSAQREGDVAGLLAALIALGQAEAVAPSHPTVLFYLGVAMERLGEEAAALDYYEAAAARAPELAAAHLRSAEILAYLYRHDDADLAVSRALAAEPDNAHAHMMRGLVSFWRDRDPGALDHLELARVLAPKDLEIRQAIKDVRHVLAGPSFPPRDRREKKTEHFLIVTDLDRSALALYAAHLEAIHAHYTEFFEPESLPEGRSQVLIFKTQEAYQTYAELTTNDRAEHTLGYFHPQYQQLLLFEDLEREQTLRVMYHEAFHQYSHHVAPAMPIWLDEGMAEYFGASEVKKGKVVRTGLVQKERLAVMRSMLDLGWPPVPFERIMLMSQAEFYAEGASFHYSQAWSMVHYFFSKPDLKKLLLGYLGALREGRSNEDAYGETFGRIDLTRIEKDWLTYVGRLR